MNFPELNLCSFCDGDDKDLQKPVTSCHTAIRGCSNSTGSRGGSGDGSGGVVVTPELHC